jgi:hypothetical protein
MTPVVCYRRATGPLGHLTPCLHMHASYGMPVYCLPRSPHCGLPLLTPDADEQVFLCALDALAGHPVEREAAEVNVPWGLVCIAFQQTRARMKQWPRIAFFGPEPRDIGVLFAWTVRASEYGLHFGTKRGRCVALTAQTRA